MGTGASRSETIRTIYLDVDKKEHRIVLSENCTSRDIKDLIASISGVSRWSNMTLKTQEGGIVVIEPNMPVNTARSAYRVCMMSASNKHGDEDDVKQIFRRMNQEKFTSIFTVSQLYTEIAEKLDHLKSRLDVEGLKAVEMMHLNQEIIVLRESIRQDRLEYENMRHYQESRTTAYIAGKSIADYPKYVFSEETKKLLKEPKFNVWEWEPNEMRSLIEFMFFELGLVQEFSISPSILKRWMMCVQANYRENPFHNFRHCFCVTQMVDYEAVNLVIEQQVVSEIFPKLHFWILIVKKLLAIAITPILSVRSMMYCMIHLCNLRELLTIQDLLILMTASVCHDLDHPGFNNMYQINARTELSIRYNDISPLENHHAAVAFDIFAQPECNIFANVSRDIFKRVRQEIIMLVLATDMARHSEIVEGFKSKIDTFDFKNNDHLASLKMMLIKCCDISNEVRPTEVSEPWVDNLLEEYFVQSDREKQDGMAVSPLMDREKVTKPKAQIGFIKLVLIPLFETLSKLFTQIDDVMISPLRKAFDHYENLRLNDEKPIQKKENVSGAAASDHQNIAKAKRSGCRRSTLQRSLGRRSKNPSCNFNELKKTSVMEVKDLRSQKNKDEREKEKTHLNKEPVDQKEEGKEEKEKKEVKEEKEPAKQKKQIPHSQMETELSSQDSQSIEGQDNEEYQNSNGERDFNNEVEPDAGENPNSDADREVDSDAAQAPDCPIGQQENENKIKTALNSQEKPSLNGQAESSSHDNDINDKADNSQHVEENQDDEENESDE